MGDLGAGVKKIPRSDVSKEDFLSLEDIGMHSNKNILPPLHLNIGV
jgi:hypothetical protein